MPYRIHSVAAGILFHTLGALSLPAQDADRDGLPDHQDSVPKVSYTPGFDWRVCPPLDLNPANNPTAEGKARERVAAFLMRQPTWVRQIALAIVRGGKVHFADAFERVGTNSLRHMPDGIHQLFRIGSTSKPMGAAAAKILEERTRLSFKDHVDDNDGTRKSSGGQVTLRQLLTHQGAFKLDSGHIYLFGFPGDLASFWKVNDDRISPHYNSANYGNLGGGYNYSAFNYALAGAYLAHRSNLTYEQVLQTLIFDRAGMATASVDAARAAKAPIGGTVGVTRNASIHLGPYINLVSPKDPYCVDNFYSSNDIYGISTYTQQSYRLDECASDVRDPAGGVMASAVDMAHFARVLIDSYHGRGTFLSAQGIKDLWQPTHDFGCSTTCPYQRYYGTGFFVATPAGKPVTEVEHGGSRAGYHSVFVLRPEAQNAVTILINANIDIVQMNKVAKAILDDLSLPTTPKWTAYGTGCPQAAPLLNAKHPPMLGRPLHLDLTSSAVNSQALLLLGSSRTTWASLPLPFDLGPLGAPGCSILVAGHLSLTMATTSQGAASLNLPIPSNPGLLGLPLYLQALVLDPQATPPGFALTRGAEMHLGRY